MKQTNMNVNDENHFFSFFILLNRMSYCILKMKKEYF